MIPPPDACAVERRLHAALLDDPRTKVAAADIAAITDADARDSAAKKARDLVVAKYTWPVVARQMLARYEARMGQQA